MTTIRARVRDVLAEYGRLTVDVTQLADTDDLYQRGLTSHASVNLMLALEEAFDVEFSDELLRKSTFESIDAIHDALVRIGATDATGGGAS